MSHRVLVTGLPAEMTHEALRAFFSSAGVVEAVERPATGGGAAFVTFPNAESVETAVGMLHGAEVVPGTQLSVTAVPPSPIAKETPRGATPLHPAAATAPTAPTTATAGDRTLQSGSRVAVGVDNGEEGEREARRELRYRPRGSGGGDPAALPTYASGGNVKDLRDMYKVCVTKLSPQTVEDDLRVFFSNCIAGHGYINDLYLDHRRNYAFVGFSTAEAMEMALKQSGTWLKDQCITIERKRILNRANRVVILGLPSDCTEEAVRIFFSGCGEMSDLHLESARGMAFANFTEPSAVTAAVAKTGEEMGGSVLTIQHREFKTCFHCNQDGHVASHCPMRRGTTGIVCHKCGKPGHKARGCDARPLTGGGSYGDERKRRRPDGDVQDRYRPREYRGERDDRDHHRHRLRLHSRSRSRSRERERDRDREHRRRHPQRRGSQSRSRSRSRSPHSHRRQRRSNRSRSPVHSSHRH